MYGNISRTDHVLELRRQGGKWLKGLRERAGLSQAELSERLQMQVYTFISQLENGRGRIPPDRYEAWAAALGIALPEFVRALLSYYDPITYRILFQSNPAANQLDDAAAQPLSVGGDADALQKEVHELQRVLGKKTAELEILQERFDEKGI